MAAATYGEGARRKRRGGGEMTLGITLPTLRCCVCNSDTIVAVAPGDEGDSALDLFAVTREVPMRAWCAEHWPAMDRISEESTS